MHVLRHRRFWIALSLCITDCLFFLGLDPSKVPSYTLIVGFLLFAASVYYLLYGILTGLAWYGLPISSHRRRLAGVGMGLIGGMVALQSVGELTGRDVVVLLPLTVMAYLYLFYGWSPRRS